MADFKSVAVAGASGRVGSAIVEGFLRRGGIDIRILQRKGASKDASLLADFAKRGVSIVEVDYSSDDHIVAALTGVDVLISALSGAGVTETQPALFRNAKAAGIKRILPSEYSFFRHDGFDPRDCFIFGTKEGLRKVVEATGLEYTYITPLFFVDDVYSSYFVDYTKEPAHVRWPVDGTGIQSGIDAREAGDLVADVLLDHWNESRNAVIELTATTWTFNESIELYKKFSGKDIKVEYLSREQVAEAIAKDPGYATLGLQLSLRAEQGKTKIHDSVIPKWFADRKFLTLEEYVKRKFGSK